MTRKLAFAFALLLAAVPCAAQQAGAPARELTTAAPIKMPAAANPAPDMFFFVGAAGARQRFTVTSKTPVEITVFGPGGDVMLSKEGRGTVTLDAVLSWIDVHTVAVTRANAATPYTIAMSASEPTLNDAFFGHFVGEQQIVQPGGATFTKCWEVPGERVRAVESGNIFILSRSGTFQTTISERNGVVTTEEFALGLRDNEYFATIRVHPGGSVRQTRLPYLDSTFQRPANLKYAGYYCADSAPR